MGIVHNKIEQMRMDFDYESYADLIDKFLAAKGITCENKRLKLNWKIWYDNRGRSVLHPRHRQGEIESYL